MSTELINTGLLLFLAASLALMAWIVRRSR